MINNRWSKEFLETKEIFVKSNLNLFEQIDLERGNYQTLIAKELIEKARIELNYSRTYVTVDIYRSLINSYKKVIGYKEKKRKEDLDNRWVKYGEVLKGRQVEEMFDRSRKKTIQTPEQIKILKELNLNHLIK